MGASAQTIVGVDLYSYSLSYVHGTYVMSEGRLIRDLESTVVRITTDSGLVGFGETCPLGTTYLPSHAAGARAALKEVAPQVVGIDATNIGAVTQAVDRQLAGHRYAKSALDIACWDLLGQSAGQPLCQLLGGRLQESFPLYVAIPLGPPEDMRQHVLQQRESGIHRFQLKLGGDPEEDARRVHAVIDATGDEDTVIGDANGGWRLAEAIRAAALLDGLPRFLLEQPCQTMEECFVVRDKASMPFILDEVITDLAALARAWNAGGLDGFNLKIARVGGLTNAKLLRDAGQSLGLMITVEDSWGGDLATAAVSHLAASTDPDALLMASFFNDWTDGHIAGYQPRSQAGRGAAPAASGLGVPVDPEALGAPFESFAS
jgi:L-alanine-DL-glutamate epimerase-like enolase superfamily enzyme